MPVIRVPSSWTALTPQRRKALLKQLTDELAGRTTTNGPVVFEIPFDQSDKIDVLVVWQAFENLRSEDQTGLILKAYKDQQGKIAQAMGVTFQEAKEQQLLPYAVTPMVHQGEVNPDDLHEAMRQEGGITLSQEKIELRFPTMAMAEAAHHRLCEKLPRGYWSIVQTVSPLA